MKPSEVTMSINAIIQESWAAMEAMRRMGFKSDDLYMVDGVIGPPGSMYEGKRCVAVLLKQGPLDFIFTVSPVKNMSIYAARWKSFVAALNEGKVTDVQLVTMYAESFCGRNEAQMRERIREKGIAIPVEAS